MIAARRPALVVWAVIVVTVAAGPMAAWAGPGVSAPRPSAEATGALPGVDAASGPSGDLGAEAAAEATGTPASTDATAPASADATGPAERATPLVTSYVVSPTRFSPRAVAAPKVATASFTTSLRAKVTVTVLNAAGSVVKSLLVVAATTPNAVYKARWDGSKTVGGRAPDGGYRIRLVASRGSAKTVTARYVTLDTVPPRLAALGASPDPFWPRAGFDSRMTITVGLSGERARVLTSLKGPGVYVAWTDMTTTTVRHTWDGRDDGRLVGYGAMTVRAVARDAAGNQASLVRVAQASPYADVGAAGAEIRQAVLSAASRRLAVKSGGMFSGDSRRRFLPTAGATRKDLAALVVRAFAPTAAGDPPTRVFSDVTSSTLLGHYASIAVARGWMIDYPDGTGHREFRPTAAATTAQVARALTRALGLASVSAKIQAQDPGTPSWGGDTVVMQDLRLRRHGAGVHPGAAYPRGELAYSAIAALTLEGWRKDELVSTFATSKLIRQSVRQRQFTLGARRFLGEPYVWGGDALSEGGFDCSGLVYHVAGNLGVSLLRTAAMQAADGRYVSIGYSGLAPGDGIYFTNGTRVFHAGMYLGDGYFIHSSGSRNGVSIDNLRTNSYYRSHLLRGKRYIPMVELRDVAISPGAFSPNRDGVKETVGIRFRTTKEATVAVVVDDARLRRVRTLMSAKRAPARFSLTWDGKDGGRVCADGRYRVRVRVVDAEQNVRFRERWVALDTSAPVLTAPAIAPDPYRPRAGTAAISVWVSQRCSVSLVVEKSDGTDVYRASRSVTGASRPRFYWKGTDLAGHRVPAGAYRMRFTAVDAAGNRGTRSRPFAVR
jgi:flagellar hook assembly protein FlgD